MTCYLNRIIGLVTAVSLVAALTPAAAYASQPSEHVTSASVELTAQAATTTSASTQAATSKSSKKSSSASAKKSSKTRAKAVRAKAARTKAARTKARSAAQVEKDARRTARKLGGKVRKVYRLYNMWTDDHLYTTSIGERRALVQASWLYEGVGWLAPRKSKTPVYRLYDARTDSHMYTASAKERKNLRKAGWIYEGIGWYSDEGKAVAVERLVAGYAESKRHLFTAARAEASRLAQGSWKLQKTGWYAISKGWSKQPNYRHEHWERLLATAESSDAITVTNGMLRPESQERLQSFLGDTYVDFVALNTRTGTVVTHNADTSHYGASTVKAPYVASLCMYDAPGIGGWQGSMHSIVTYSSNDLFMRIASAYGHPFFDRMAEESGTAIRYTAGGPYAEFTPRELAQLWATMADYLNHGGPNVDMFRGLFGNGGYFKAGWMYAGMLGGQLYHKAGVEGDVVYAIMTGYQRPNQKIWDLRDALVEALS